MEISKGEIVSWLRAAPLVGRVLLWLARRYREGSVVTIKMGEGAGYRWKRHHRYVSSYWLGTYELPVQRTLVRELRPGDVFYDLGANAGFFSLIASRCVGPGGRVIAFEPLPCNAKAIEELFVLNALENCSLVEAAVSDGEGHIEFAADTDTSTARIKSPKGANASVHVVRTVTLDQFVQSAPPPDLIKMDVEGAEVLALRGAGGLLRSERPPKLLIELHGEEVASEVQRILIAASYDLVSLDRSHITQRALPRHILAVPSDKLHD